MLVSLLKKEGFVLRITHGDTSIDHDVTNNVLDLVRTEDLLSDELGLAGLEVISSLEQPGEG